MRVQCTCQCTCTVRQWTTASTVLSVAQTLKKIMFLQNVPRVFFFKRAVLESQARALSMTISPRPWWGRPSIEPPRRSGLTVFHLRNENGCIKHTQRPRVLACSYFFSLRRPAPERKHGWKAAKQLACIQARPWFIYIYIYIYTYIQYIYIYMYIEKVRRVTRQVMKMTNEHRKVKRITAR